MSYGDEQAESRRLHSILKEGEGSMTEVGRNLRREAMNTLEEIIEGTEPDRIGSYEPLKRWVHRKAKEVRSAIEAEAAALTPGALDVERLARAIYNATPLRHVGGIGEPDEWATAIAAAYARLSAGQAEEANDG